MILVVDIVRSTKKAARLAQLPFNPGDELLLRRRPQRRWRRFCVKGVVTTGVLLVVTFDAQNGSAARPPSAKRCVRWGWRSGWGCTPANTR